MIRRLKRPFFYPAAFHVPASDNDIITGVDPLQHNRDKCRGMGEIRIHNKEDIRLCLSEPFDHGLGEPGIFVSDHKVEMRFCFLEFPDQFNGPVRGIIVNDEDLSVDLRFGKKPHPRSQ